VRTIQGDQVVPEVFGEVGEWEGLRAAVDAGPRYPVDGCGQSRRLGEGSQWLGTKTLLEPGSVGGVIDAEGGRRRRRDPPAIAACLGRGADRVDEPGRGQGEHAGAVRPGPPLDEDNAGHAISTAVSGLTHDQTGVTVPDEYDVAVVEYGVKRGNDLVDVGVQPDITVVGEVRRDDVCTGSPQ
jgi:hypothetical protein